MATFNGATSLLSISTKETDNLSTMSTLEISSILKSFDVTLIDDTASCKSDTENTNTFYIDSISCTIKPFQSNQVFISEMYCSSVNEVCIIDETKLGKLYITSDGFIDYIKDNLDLFLEQYRQSPSNNYFKTVSKRRTKFN